MRTVKLELGGLSLDLAPTPLARLAKASAFLSGGGTDEAGVEGLCEAIFWGLRRAKSEVTLDFVIENVDAVNQQEVIEAFLDVNGLKPKEQAAAGEAAAGEAS